MKAWRAKLIILLSGPNGAGKTTFYEAHLADMGLPFINADQIAREFFGNQDPGTSIPAASIAKERRHQMINEGRSFIFETVLSDPVGDKIEFLKFAKAEGYFIDAHFIGLLHSDLSRARVAGRVINGGHDVPDDKLVTRYPRTLKNLELLVPVADRLVLYDNSEAVRPHRPVAIFEEDVLRALSPDIPPYLAFLNLPARTQSSTVALP